MNSENLYAHLLQVSEEFRDSTKEQVKEETLLDTLEQPLNEIVLFNDEVNTFDHVIDTLMYACEHTPEQAEQCSIIVHYKGKCTVKTGSYDDLEPRCSMLLEAGLSAEIV
ncbi:ATP-dependent Clp protease adaptor ClpS [Sediminibacter sp. Hel_I_10]|uniref:ATP-dependent Clp protease adaptor ClpS n=1 Tax=Sediminibacter sp. Hel_I_10 TaxID=1392490 RepID=UPI00068D3A3C|nr:ATP-dependent Clp protease adaptor ClpS [Sediminibacter sp. Hel_I_10]